MNLLDVFILVPLLLGLIRGLYNGFINELTALIALLAGIYIAYHFYDEVFSILATYIEGAGTGTMIASFVGIFVLVVLGINLLGSLLTKVIGILAMGLLNRLAGGIFGFFKAVVILLFFCMLLLPYLKAPELNQTPFIAESTLLPFLIEYALIMEEMLPDLYARAGDIQQELSPEP